MTVVDVAADPWVVRVPPREPWPTVTVPADPWTVTVRGDGWGTTIPDTPAPVGLPYTLPFTLAA